MALQAALAVSSVARSKSCCSGVGFSLTLAVSFILLLYKIPFKNGGMAAFLPWINPGVSCREFYAPRPTSYTGRGSHGAEAAGRARAVAVLPATARSF